MRELDQLLNRWLDQSWATASEAQRGVFLQLLDCEDDKLWRWFLGRETVLGLAAALAVLASEMPRVAAWPLALIALAYGTWRAWHEARQAVLHIVILPDEGACKVDGAPVDAMSVRWRGPIACLHWRGGDGCRQRCVFWPDTLPAMQRRELRLAAPAPLTARVPTSMAP